MRSGWRAQLAIGLTAGALWAVYPVPTAAALLASYAGAWLLVELATRLAPRAQAAAVSPRAAVVLTLLVGAPALAQAARLGERFLAEERLDAIEHLVGARLRLEHTPSIAPPLIAADRPQTFYVHAPGATRLEATLGRTVSESHALGHGLFRVAYDPRRDGPPRGEAALSVDGETSRRALRAVRPLPHPRWLRPAPDRQSAATVSEETDELLIVDRGGLRHRVRVLDGPTDVVFVSPDRVLVVHGRATEALLIDARTGHRLRRLEVGPSAVRASAIAVGASEIAVGASEIMEREPETGAAVVVAIARAGPAPEVLVLSPSGRARVALPAAPDWVELGPRGETLAVATRADAALHRFARDEHGTFAEDVPPLHLGRPAVTLARSHDGAMLVAAVTDLRTDGRPHLGNHFVLDQLVTIDALAWRVTGARPTASRSARQDAPGNVDRGVSPMGVDLAPDGSLRVAFAGTDDLWFERPGDARPRTIALAAPLAAPASVVALSDGSSWVSAPAYGALARLSRGGEVLDTVRLAPDDRALLRDDPEALQRRIGERTFYESTRAGVSCQSCHLHGESDGGRHNIGGSTLVATLDVRGLLGTPPYLRDGGYALLGSLDELSQTLYRGYARPQGGRRASLDRYLSDLPRPTPRAQLAGRDLPRERRGLDVFVRARCVLCHAFPAFTNLGQHPAIAVFPRYAREHAGAELDTPSLLGLGGSAPYFVDGRAIDLRAVFKGEPAGRHGDTADLTDADLDDLLFFLEDL